MPMEVNMRVHSMEAECSPSLAASTAAVAKTGSSQCSKPRKFSPNAVHSLGTPSQPAKMLPMASTVSGPVMETGDS